MNRRFGPWRRIAEALQALMVLGIPFIRVRGESALRFDIPSLKLHVFGTSLWMDEFFVVLMAIIFLTFLIVFITQLFGRIWCGWLCPQTVLTDLTRFLERSRGGSIPRKALALLMILAISIIVSASLVWYFVSPYDFFPALLGGGIGPITMWIWMSLSLVMFLNLAFLRQTWCASVCPYSRLQGALFDSSTMVIAFDDRRKDECMGCAACADICPVRIDIRKGLSAACINCAECVDACSEKMDRRKKKGLIGYFFGKPGDEVRLLRPGVLITGSATLLTLALLLYLSFARSVLDMTVLPANDFRPRITAQNEAVNAYTLALRNRGRQDLELMPRTELDGISLKTQPAKILLAAGEYRRVVVYAFAPVSGRSAPAGTVELTLEAGIPERISISRKAGFIAPEVQ